MPWQFKPKKDAVAGDTLRWGGKQLMTRRFPNGATYMLEEHVIHNRGGYEIGNRVKWNISVTRGKEKKGFKYFHQVNKIWSSRLVLRSNICLFGSSKQLGRPNIFIVSFS